GTAHRYRECVDNRGAWFSRRVSAPVAAGAVPARAPTPALHGRAPGTPRSITRPAVRCHRWSGRTRRRQEVFSAIVVQSWNAVRPSICRGNDPGQVRRRWRPGRQPLDSQGIIAETIHTLLGSKGKAVTGFLQRGQRGIVVIALFAIGVS